jgi:transcriptional regulator with XRE-family HTH domain
MNEDPIVRIRVVFGLLVRRLRDERNLPTEALAAAVGLSDNEISQIELGRRDPTLTDIFKIANALRTPLGLLLVDLIGAWRDKPYDPLYKSRPSDFAKLYRLGYQHAHGDFREYPKIYSSFFDDALTDARTLNTVRYSKKKPLLDTVCIYVRMHYINFSWEPWELKK